MSHPTLDFEYRSPYPDGLPGHAKDSDTSKAAAESVLDGCNDLQRRVYAEIYKRGANGRTVFEIMRALDLIKDTVAPRVTELHKQNAIKDSGRRRRSPSGRPCTVWVAEEV